MLPAFYRDLGDGRVFASRSCAGPWDPAAQHGGPPSALLVREVERLAGWPGTVVRVTCEILGPVPLGELEVRARVARPGRSVEMVEAELVHAARTVLACRAWRVRAPDLGAVRGGDGEPGDAGPDGFAGSDGFAGPDSLPASEGSTDPTAWEGLGWSGGYLGAMEWRFVEGAFDRSGPAGVWTRPRVELVAGEPASPLQRVLLAADPGNGVSGELDIRSWMFINPELTVHLHRPPRGDWVGLQASTTVATEHGTGLAHSRLWDLEGPVGWGAQSLLVAPRERP